MSFKYLSVVKLTNSLPKRDIGKEFKIYVDNARRVIFQKNRNVSIENCYETKPATYL